MDLHPSGLPHLVGPEGSQFSFADHSHSFRYLPNNVDNELLPPKVEQLSLLRSKAAPLQVRAAPSSPRGAAGPHPLRLCTDNPSPGSPREQLPSSPSRHLLTSRTTPVPARLPSHNTPPLTIDTPAETITIAAAGTVEVHQAIESPVTKE
ncbi:hypothetical protein L7F22_030002 [Adiantum nelumboides]|nr:hypothetical protein [Adiantum nelumboides]